MTSKESKAKMIANSEDKVALQRMAGRLCIALGLAATAGMVLSAAATPVRLVGVTTEGNTVLIESTEPVAYSVSRPDPLSLVVDLRNVSVSDARADVAKEGAIAGVRLEQASATDWSGAGARPCRSRQADRVRRPERPQHDPGRVEGRRVAVDARAGADQGRDARTEAAADAGRGFDDRRGRAAATSGASGQGRQERPGRRVRHTGGDDTRANQLEQDARALPP